jgi:putative PIN family toxin of toxin-antitoxin system
VNRVTADSNILISAFLRGGKSLDLVEFARAGQVELAVSDAILDETARVLNSKFKVPDEDVQAYRQERLGFSKHVTPTETLDAVPADTTDNRVLECAVAASSETIVTGDAHLLSLGAFREIKIERVAAFLARFFGRPR